MPLGALARLFRIVKVFQRCPEACQCPLPPRLWHMGSCPCWWPRGRHQGSLLSLLINRRALARARLCRKTGETRCYSRKAAFRCITRSLIQGSRNTGLPPSSMTNRRRPGRGEPAYHVISAPASYPRRESSSRLPGLGGLQQFPYRGRRHGTNGRCRASLRPIYCSRCRCHSSRAVR